MKLFKKKEEPELVTSDYLLKRIEEKLTNEELKIFIQCGGLERLNSFMFFYNNEEVI